MACTPAVLKPERFRRSLTRPTLLLRWAALNLAATFQRFVTLAVLLPERFRGGCAFGGGLIDLFDSATLSRRSELTLVEVTHQVKRDEVNAQRTDARVANAWLSCRDTGSRAQYL